MSGYVSHHYANDSSPADDRFVNTQAALKRIAELSDFQSPIDIIKSRILFDKDLSETLESVRRMTLDELWWLYEQLIIKETLVDSYQRDQERIAELERQKQQ